MTQVPIIAGIKANRGAEFDRSFPLNLEPVILDTNLSKGQLRLTPGTKPFAVGPGVDRGGVNWLGVHYRAMGTKIVRISSIGQVEILGDIGGGEASFTYSFDRLGIRSNNRLFYWDGTSLSQVTDPDLGAVIDLEWFAGYFVTTDGTSIVVTELSNPLAVDPLKYGSAESDPDMVNGLIKLRNELYVLGRHTIQPFQNVGGNGFPFRPILSAIIPYGCISAKAKCLMGDTIAFVGSARDEALGVYIAGQGTANKISTKEIDGYLAALPNPELVRVESRTSRDERRLLVRLPDRTLCFLFEASQAAGEPVWHELQSGQGKPYRIVNSVMCYNSEIVGDLESAQIAILDYETAAHFGEDAEWKFEAGLVYNEGKSSILHDVELVSLTGRGQGQTDLFFSVSTDGVHWSNEASLQYSTDTRRRVAWRPHFRFQNYMAMRFRGLGSAIVGLARLEANLEKLR